MEISSTRAPLQALARPTPGADAARRSTPVGGGFAQAFDQALRSVSDQQQQATRLQQAVVAGAPEASLEETMLAMQKAQIGFQSALHVRNRMVQAYSDIMNMQV